jgi:uncharacterized protein
MSLHFRARARVTRDAVVGSPRRWAVFTLGVGALALGVTLTVVAGLGVGSWQVLETGLVETTGAPFGVVAVVESLLVLTVAWVWLRQAPGSATVLMALVLGPIIGWGLDTMPPPATTAHAAVMLAVGTVAIGAGVGFYVAAELGASAQDSLFVGLYKRYRIRVGTARFVTDVSLVAAGWALGGQVGAGTVVVTFALPPIVERALGAGQRWAHTSPDPTLIAVAETP